MIKRLCDILAALIGVMIASPIMCLCALFIRFDSNGPILFKHERAGKNGKPIFVYKFRTMVEDADTIGPVITSQNDPRVTQVGGLLRWLKFDELPQLFNVLKGDMSLVGPRPEAMKIVDLYSTADREVLSVKPGVFGPSQISNRDEASILTETDDVEEYYAEKILPEKIKRDIQYIRNQNPFKDIQILFGGIFSVLLSSIKFKYILESRRRILFLLFDLMVCLVSYYLSFLVRFEGNIPAEEWDHLVRLLPFVVLLRAPCFIYFGLYQTLWQYLGIQELLSIIKSVTIGSIIIPFLPFLLQMSFPPRSVWIMDWLILIIALGGSRVFFKITSERLRAPRGGRKKNALIIGAGDAGELLVREYIKQPALGYKPIGFLDDDPLKQSVRIHGVKVMGKISQLSQAVRVKKADEVIIAISKASGKEIREIMKTCSEIKIPCRIIPHASTLMAANALPLKLRPVNVSDLLGRELVEADLDSIQAMLSAKRVMVTGAGGSIGSELARLIFQNGPEELIMVDNSESSIYEVERDLQATPSNTSFSCYLLDIKNREELRKVIARHQPDIIYHAAAYKHVPLMEVNYAAGVLNNVMGTRNVADLAVEYSVKKFVLISTDKAINPRSVMGATKRIAELYTQGLNGGKTHFMAVRFGNVFNSKGSVVPLFKRQIEQGGPVTVTDENVTRYFMDVSEAVFLILQASILGRESEIFILDMGQPVKIVDLAKNLIQLMGLTTETIPIKFIGLRPGEKLEEEIEFRDEDGIPTSHKKINIWKSKYPIPTDIKEKVDELIQLAANNGSREDVIEKIKDIVPEYHPWHLSV